MSAAQDLAAEKRDELVSAIERALQKPSSWEANAGKTMARSIIDTFATIEPPEEGPVTMSLIVMGMGGRGGGESTKPGNVLLHLGELFVALSKGAFTAAGVAKYPWLAVFGAIIVWNEFWACAQANLTEEEASVLYAMWMHRDSDSCIRDVEVERKVSLEREKYGFAPLSLNRVRSCLRSLEDIRCIKRSKSDPAKWWLREWVRFVYR